MGEQQGAGDYRRCRPATMMPPANGINDGFPCPMKQYQELLSVRRLTALHSSFLQTTPHDIALAFGYYFRYHNFMAEEFTYKDFNLLSSAHAGRIQGH